MVVSARIAAVLPVALLLALACADAPPTCTPPPEPPVQLDDPQLSVFTMGGSADSLLLEWEGGPRAATGWQYRESWTEHHYDPPAWGPWINIPGDGTTRCYVVEGLDPDGFYAYQVRPSVPKHLFSASPPGPSEAARGTVRLALDGVLSMPQSPERLQGDGIARWWVHHSTLIIPDGVRVSLRDYPEESDGPGTILSVEGWGDLVFKDNGSITLYLWYDDSPFAPPRLTQAQQDQLVDSIEPPPKWGIHEVTPTPTPQSEAELSYPSARGYRVPSLIIISDGKPDSLILEWYDGPDSPAKWQYRHRRWENWEPQPWSAWTDIPGSNADTRSYRVTGLRPASPYDVEVRPVLEGAERARVGWWASSPAYSVTHEQDALPTIQPQQRVKGDGRTEWRIGRIAFTIPDGMQLEEWSEPVANRWPERAFIDDCPTPPPYPRDADCFAPDRGAGLWHTGDNGSGSKLYIDADGKEIRRDVKPGIGGHPTVEDVHALFDQILESVRPVREDY